jgi:hypothetical protein
MSVVFLFVLAGGGENTRLGRKTGSVQMKWTTLTFHFYLFMHAFIHQPLAVSTIRTHSHSGHQRQDQLVG